MQAIGKWFLEYIVKYLIGLIADAVEAYKVKKETKKKVKEANENEDRLQAAKDIKDILR